MGLLSRLFGRREPRYDPTYDAAPPPPSYSPSSTSYPPQQPRDEDAAAVERYRYLLRTAPPDRIEQAHAEAFERLTPEQRRQVLADLSREVPEHERAGSDDPRSLARMATRAEVRSPGTLERAFGRGPGAGYGGVGYGGMGLGGMVAGSLLASVAGAFVGTAIADAMFDFDDSGDLGGESGDYAGGEDGGGEDVSAGGDFSDAGGDFGGDFGGGDFGGDFGDI